MPNTLVANIKGPPGPTGATGAQGPAGPQGPAATIPEPLIVNELQAGSMIYVGTKMRLVGLANGGKLEVMDGTGAWIVQSRWTEA
jgi:hypothetical protein